MKTHQLIVPTLNELKQQSAAQLTQLAEDIRQFLISNISATGGHIGANLSVVELTVAIHALFDSPADKVIFDTGHQGYTHKILTGRVENFATLNQYRGMNRFVARDESEHDAIDASHAGTSLSIASGYAKALKLTSPANYVVSLIGDGSMVEGMAFEGLNYCAEDKDSKLVIVLNDNEMAIAKSVGGMRNLTAGENWQSNSRAFFEGMGFAYLLVEDGHDMPALLEQLAAAKQLARPVIVHVKTEKGKGLACAKDHPYKMHFSMPFDAATGKGAAATVVGRTYAVVAAEALKQKMTTDDDVFAMTPATPYASSLDECLALFPERALDVGMAEQQAVGMACGLALGGKKPVVCMQTTFMQRAYDQLIHDACYMDLPVTVFGVRAGFAGYDGATHHGIYDIPYLRSFPNMQLVYPASSAALTELIEKRLDNPQGPMVILYPYEPIPTPEPDTGLIEPCGLSVPVQGRDGYLVCLGNRLVAAYELKALLEAQGKDYGIICVQSIKPFPAERFVELVAPTKHLITLEESVLNGGFGSLVLETLADANLSMQVLRSGVDDKFVYPGSKDECSAECGMMPGQIIEQIAQQWPNYLGVNK
ncbi:Transketolase central region [Shewanella halifaxensis HAW-EB4]|uniref:1-deoxy-D-xylulose-5-phosphate synthase n=1 Tax=Shewanella halifaxensis (strain HAW-EB4) TaxID=458817 RepID=B0TLL6_SHEHH|nr:1-deoxy-D-xylulose-5-phosphate synthase [Shewanella halifaxensis]ABZ75966.1 Transketolase central region [Shewanella halifaxensis HAW-EB4]